MENQINKPPKSAMAYYVKLFCKKKKRRSARETYCIQKALKSWMTLSIAEQQPFIDKFKKCQEIYKEKCATYLRTVEPFLKKKIIREESNDDTSMTQTEENDHERKDTDNESNSGSINNHLYTASVIETVAGELTGEQTTNYASEKSIKLPEPTPPFIITHTPQKSLLRNKPMYCRINQNNVKHLRNGKELFETVNKITESNNLQWKDLSQLERGKYQSAVHAIKREYIKNYLKYLESLSSKELFQHYIKSLEKYW